MTVEPIFFDTNILVYANDISATSKREHARSLIHEALVAGNGVISSQVLAEFWVTVTRKFKQPLERSLAREQIALLSAFIILPVDQETFLAALTIQDRYDVSFWDAQIIASARLGGIPCVYSEDLQNGGVYEGVTVTNPFQ